MGKCLSCCNVDQSTELQNNEKFSDVIHKLDCGNNMPSANVTEPWRGRTVNAETSLSLNSNGETHTNSCSKSVSLTEKLMFYPRIPPILSSSCTDKRSSHCSREFSESKINALFEVYKDPNEDAILSDGIERLCVDLNIRPEEFRTLLLAWKFSAKQMCCFTKEEFVEGCKKLKADSVQDIQARFPEMLNEIQEAEKFKDFYRFTFKFGLESGQRVLMSEMAIQLWKLVFYYREPPILERWLAFLEKHPSIHSITRDTWNMFLNFSETVGNDLSTYDDSEAWPSLFDDFVEYENDQTNQNIVPSKNKSVIEL